MCTKQDSKAARPRAAERRPTSGFSLIELMVVVAIVGVLAAIAYPSYSRFVFRSHRTDAIRTLTNNAQILQRCYSQFFAFNNAGCAGVPAAVTPNGYYNVANVVTATTYTLTATPAGPQVGDTTCASFTIDQTGRQSALDTGNADQSQTCWGTN